MTKTLKQTLIALLSVLMAACLTAGLVLMLSAGGSAQVASAASVPEINYKTVGVSELEIDSDGVLSGFKEGGSITVNADGYAQGVGGGYDYSAGWRIRIEVPKTVKYIAEGAFSDCIDVADIVIPDGVYWQVTPNGLFKIDNTLKYAANDGKTATISDIVADKVKANLIIPSPIWYDENNDGVMAETEKYTYTEFLGDISFDDIKITSKNLLITANVINLYAANQPGTAVTPDGTAPNKQEAVEEAQLYLTESIPENNILASNSTFTVSVFGEVKSNSSSKTFNTGTKEYSFKKYLQISGFKSGTIGFKIEAKNAGIISVYGISSGTDERYLELYDSEYALVNDESRIVGNKDEASCSEAVFNIPDAGTYYIGSKSSSINIFAIVLNGQLKDVPASPAAAKIAQYPTQKGGDVPAVEGALRKSSTIESIFFAKGRTTVLPIYRTTFEDYSALKIISLSAGVLLADGARAFQGADNVKNIYVAEESNSNVPAFYAVGEDGALYSGNYSYEYYSCEGMRQYLQQRADQKLLGQEFAPPAAASSISNGASAISDPVMSPSENAIMPTALDEVISVDFSDFTAQKYTSELTLVEGVISVTGSSSTGFEIASGSYEAVGETFSKRLDLGGKAKQPDRFINFNLSGAAKIDIWVTGNGSRSVALYDAEFQPTSQSYLPPSAGQVCTYNIEEAGTYHVGSNDGQIRIYKIVVTPVAGGPVTSDPAIELSADKTEVYKNDPSSQTVTLTAILKNIEDTSSAKLTYEVVDETSVTGEFEKDSADNNKYTAAVDLTEYIANHGDKTEIEIQVKCDGLDGLEPTPNKITVKVIDDAPPKPVVYANDISAGTKLALNKGEEQPFTVTLTPAQDGAYPDLMWYVSAAGIIEINDTTTSDNTHAVTITAKNGGTVSVCWWSYSQNAQGYVYCNTLITVSGGEITEEKLTDTLSAYQRLVYMPPKNPAAAETFTLAYSQTTEIGGSSFPATKYSVIIIPQNVTKIGDYAFRFSKNLQTIYLPQGVEIGHAIFGEESDAELTAEGAVKNVYTAGKKNFTIIVPSRQMYMEILAANSAGDSATGNFAFAGDDSVTDNNGYDYTPYLTYEIQIKFSANGRDQTEIYLYNRPVSYIKAEKTTEWANAAYDNNAELTFGHKSGSSTQNVNLTQGPWSVAAGGWYDTVESTIVDKTVRTFPTAAEGKGWYYGQVEVGDNPTAFLTGAHSGEIKYADTQEFDDPCNSEGQTIYNIHQNIIVLKDEPYEFSANLLNLPTAKPLTYKGADYAITDLFAWDNPDFALDDYVDYKVTSYKTPQGVDGSVPSTYKNAGTYTITFTVKSEHEKEVEFEDGYQYVYSLEVVIAQKEITVTPPTQTIYVDFSYPKQAENKNNPKPYDQTMFSSFSVEGILPADPDLQVLFSYDFVEGYNAIHGYFTDDEYEDYDNTDVSIYEKRNYKISGNEYSPTYGDYNDVTGDSYDLINITLSKENSNYKLNIVNNEFFVEIISDKVTGYVGGELYALDTSAIFSENPSNTWLNLPNNGLKRQYFLAKDGATFNGYYYGLYGIYATTKYTPDFDMWLEDYISEHKSFNIQNADDLNALRKVYPHVMLGSDAVSVKITSDSGVEYDDEMKQVKNCAVIRNVGNYEIKLHNEDHNYTEADIFGDFTINFKVNKSRIYANWFSDRDYYFEKFPDNSNFGYMEYDYANEAFSVAGTYGELTCDAYWIDPRIDPTKRNSVKDFTYKRILRYNPNTYSTDYDDIVAAYDSSTVVDTIEDKEPTNLLGKNSYDAGTYYLVLQVDIDDTVLRNFVPTADWDDAPGTYFASEEYYFYFAIVIKPVTLTVDIDGTAAKTYNGENQAVTLNVTGLAYGDKTHTVSEYLTEVSAKNAGTYHLSLTNSSDTELKVAFKTEEEGNTTRVNSQNYILQLGSNTEFTINKRQLVLEVNDSNLPYTGEELTLDVLFGEYSDSYIEPDGFAAGEEKAPQDVLVADADSLKNIINVGTYYVSLKDEEGKVKISLNTEYDKNYYLTLASASFYIVPVDITLTISGGFTYDSIEYTNNAILSKSGVILSWEGIPEHGQKVDTSTNLTVTGVAVKNAKTYTVGKSGTDIIVALKDAPNYNLIAVSGTITVNKKQVTVTASGTFTYNEDTQYPVLATTDIYAGDYIGSLAGCFTVTSAAVNKGTYNVVKEGSGTDITVVLKDELTANYDLYSVSGQITINAAELTLTVSGGFTYSGSSIEYTGNDILSQSGVTLSWAGIPEHGQKVDNSTNLTVTGSVKNAKTYTVGLAESGADIQISLNGLDNYYTLKIAEGSTVTISTATITIGGSYSGTVDYDPEMSYHEVEVTSLTVNGIIDAFTLKITLTTKGNELKTYTYADGSDELKREYTFVGDGDLIAAVKDNYTVVWATTSLSVTVQKKVVTVVWQRNGEDFTQSEVEYSAQPLELTAKTSDGHFLAVTVSAQEGSSLTEGKAKDVGKYVFTASSEYYELTGGDSITVTITPHEIVVKEHVADEHNYDLLYGQTPVWTSQPITYDNNGEKVVYTYTLTITPEVLSDGLATPGIYSYGEMEGKATLADGCADLGKNYTFSFSDDVTYQLNVAPFALKLSSKGSMPYNSYDGGYTINTSAFKGNVLGIELVPADSQANGLTLTAPQLETVLAKLQYTVEFEDMLPDGETLTLYNAGTYTYSITLDSSCYDIFAYGGEDHGTSGNKFVITTQEFTVSLVNTSVTFNNSVQNAAFKIMLGELDVTEKFISGGNFVNFDGEGKFGSGSTPVISVAYSGTETTPLNAGGYTVTLTVAESLKQSITLSTDKFAYTINRANLNLSGDIDLVAYAASHGDFDGYMTFSDSAKTVKISNAYAFASLGANSYNLPLSDFADLFGSVEDSLYGQHVVITIGAGSEAVENKKVTLSAENISFETEGSADNFNITVSSAATYTIKPYQTEVSWKYMGAAVVSVGGVPTVTHTYNGKRLFNEGLITYSAHHVDGEEVTLNADNTSRDIKLARGGDTYSIEIIRSVGEYTVTVETLTNKNYKLTNNVIKIIINPYVISSDVMSNLLVYRNATTTNILQSGTYSYGEGARVTAYNSFAQYREGGSASEITYNKSGTITLPNNGTVVGYENIFDFTKENVKGNTGTEVGLYNMTFTLALKALTHTDTGLTFNNYVWDVDDNYYASLHAASGRNYGETITHNSDDTLSVQKTWYIVEFPNGLKSQLDISGKQWTFGETPEITSYPAARRDGAKMLMSFGTYNPGVTDYDHGYDGTADWIKHWSEVHELGRTNFIHKDDKDLPVLTDGDIKAFIDKWLNASTPAGQYMLVVIIQEAEVIGDGGANITYEEFSASYMFTVNGASLSLTSEQIAKQAEGYRHAYDGEAHYPAADTDLQLATTIDFSKLRGADTDKNGWANSTITRPGATTLTVNIDEEFYGNIKGVPEISLVYSGEWENGYHTADDPTWRSESNVYLPLKVNVETVGGAPANMPYKLYYKIAVANFGEFITVDGDVLGADEQFFNMYITAQQLNVKVEGQDEAVSWIFGQKTTLTISVDNYAEVIKTNAITGKKDEISLGYRFVDSSSATQYDAVSVELSPEGTVQINIPAALQKHGAYTLRVFMGDYNVGSFINNNYNYVVADGKGTLTGIKEFALTVSEAEISDTNNGGHPVPTDRHATYSFRPLDYLSETESSFYGVLYEQGGSYTKDSVALLKGEYTVWVYLLDPNYVWAEEMGAQTKSVDGVSYSCVQRKFTVDPREIWLSINPAELKSEYTGSAQQFTGYQIATKGADGDLDDIIRSSSGIQNGKHFKVEYYLNGAATSPLGAAEYTVRITLIYNPSDNVYAAENLVFAGFVDRNHKDLAGFEGTISDDGDYKSAIAEFTFEITPVHIRIVQKPVESGHSHAYNGNDYYNNVFDTHYSIERVTGNEDLHYLGKNGYEVFYKTESGDDASSLVDVGAYSVWFKLLGNVDVLGTTQDFARNYQLRIDGKDIGLEEVKAGVQIGTFTISPQTVTASVRNNGRFVYSGENLFETIKNAVRVDGTNVTFTVEEIEIIDVGSYTLNITVDNNHAFAGGGKTAKLTVTVTRKSLTPALSASSAVYSGKAQTVEVVIPGLSASDYTVTISRGSQQVTAPVAAGRYTVSVTLNAAAQKNYSLTASSFTYIVNAAHISVSYDGTEFIYNGKNHISEVPAHITVKNLSGTDVVPAVTLDMLSGGAITDAGTYKVTYSLGSQVNNFDIYDRTNTSLIGRESAEIGGISVLRATLNVKYLGEKSFHYNGHNQYNDLAAGFTVVNNLNKDLVPAYQILVNGSGKEFTDLGSYTVTVVISAEDALNFVLEGDSTVLVDISGIVVYGVNWKTEGSYVYTGSALDAPKAYARTDMGEIELEVVSPSQMIDVGKYTFTAKLRTDLVLAAGVSNNPCTVYVRAAKATLHKNSFGVTYDGLSHTLPELNITFGNGKKLNEGEYTITGAKSVTNAGRYVYTVKLSQNYTFGTTSYATVIFNVNKAKAQLTSQTSVTAVYDGAEKAMPQIVIECGGKQLEAGADYTVKAPAVKPINAGVYEYTVTLGKNYTFDGGATATITLNVEKAQAQLTSQTSVTAVYDGAEKAMPQIVIECGGKQLETGADYTVKAPAAKPINAGVYEYAVTLGNNYTFDGGATVTVTLNVEKAQATITAEGGSVTYDGAPHGIAAPTVESWVKDVIITYNGIATQPVTAGEYQVVITVPGTENYNGATKTVTFTVNKKAVSVNWSSASEFTYNGNYQTPYLGLNDGVSGTIVTVTYKTSAGVIMDSPAYAVGSYMVEVSLAQGVTNYELQGETQKSFTIKASQTSVTPPDNPDKPDNPQNPPVQPGDNADSGNAPMLWYIVLIIGFAAVVASVPCAIIFVRRNKLK